MKEKNFEFELPQGYQPVFHIDAQNIKTGIILNAIAVVILFLTIAIALILLMPLSVATVFPLLFWGLTLSLIPIIIYMILNELIHGIAYKSLTGQKLTFGISWSCAFCGVPNIYTYRKTALIAVLAPFVTFTVIFAALMIALYCYGNTVWYMASVILMGSHLGGCCGDLYVACLLLFKYKNKRILMKDTGPKQTFYLPNN
ncbi:MAG: DUF3267 domain-containing protein [Ruminococcaceae bacterium]|nr:DUF3267 domain-containing protein [Oscillospiraceae bacterium]